MYDGTKIKSKLPSIKDLTREEETSIVRQMLKPYIVVRDDNLSANELIDKYRSELESLCAYDNDTKDFLGFVNTWWVFSEVSHKIDYPVTMVEADNIGYKRSKRGEKVMPNELYRTDNNDRIIIDDGKDGTILDLLREINWD